MPPYLLARVSACVPNAEHVWSSSAGALFENKIFLFNFMHLQQQSIIFIFQPYWSGGLELEP